MSAAGERSPMGAALAYARAGWPVFPCRPGSKEPATRNGFHDASTDERQIRDWWRREPDRNVAIATGAPGPDVLDVDVREDGSGFPALNTAKRAGLAGGHSAVVRTPSTGLHLYFAGTDQRSGSLRGQHLDFRSRGGYVVAPPSRAAGAAYVVVGHHPATGGTVSWDAIRNLLAPQPQAARDHGPHREPGCGAGRQADVGRLANWVAAREPGDRNFPLFYAAKQAALSGLLDGAAVEGFVEAARRSGLRGGEPEARRTIESGRRAAEREAWQPQPSFGREPPGTKRRERQIKARGGASRHCPECGVMPRDQQKETAMFGSKHRDDASQQAEAVAPPSAADRQAGVGEGAPNYRRQIISDRAARVMREIGNPLAREARASGPELTGRELDREIDRLAHLYPEPGLDEPADPGRYLEAGQ